MVRVNMNGRFEILMAKILRFVTLHGQGFLVVVLRCLLRKKFDSHNNPKEKGLGFDVCPFLK
jgi:hypothetical protein